MLILSYVLSSDLRRHIKQSMTSLYYNMAHNYTFLLGEFHNFLKCYLKFHCWSGVKNADWLLVLQVRNVETTCLKVILETKQTGLGTKEGPWKRNADMKGKNSSKLPKCLTYFHRGWGHVGRYKIKRRERRGHHVSLGLWN